MGIKYTELVKKVKELERKMVLLQQYNPFKDPEYKLKLLTDGEIKHLIIKHPKLTYKDIVCLYPDIEYTIVQKGVLPNDCFTAMRGRLAREGKIVTDYICDICGKKYFLSKPGLKKHKMMMHKVVA